MTQRNFVPLLRIEIEMHDLQKKKNMLICNCRNIPIDDHEKMFV